MPAIPLKPQYGPTLGRLLAPSWRAASRPLRALVLAALAAVVALIAGAVLTLEDSVINHGAPLPFSFSYKGLYRTAPEPGGYVRVARSQAGHLEDSFAVAPAHLPPYRASITGELPLWATGVVAELQRRYGQNFAFEGEGYSLLGKLRVYNILFTVQRGGIVYYGRDVLITPERARVREGALITMLSAVGESRQVTGPAHVGGTGVLQRPLETFRLG